MSSHIGALRICLAALALLGALTGVARACGRPERAHKGLGNYNAVSTAPTALILCSKNPNRREPEVSTLCWDFTFVLPER
jgi:hypothetical protein